MDQGAASILLILGGGAATYIVTRLELRNKVESIKTETMKTASDAQALINRKYDELTKDFQTLQTEFGQFKDKAALSEIEHAEERGAFTQRIASSEKELERMRRRIRRLEDRLAQGQTERDLLREQLAAKDLEKKRVEEQQAAAITAATDAIRAEFNPRLELLTQQRDQIQERLDAAEQKVSDLEDELRAERQKNGDTHGNKG